MSNSNQGGYRELPPMQDGPIGGQRRPGCNPIFLIIAAAIAFFLFSNMLPQAVDPNAVPDQNSANAPLENGRRDVGGSQTADRVDSGWEMEEIKSTPSTNPPAREVARPRKSSQEGWEMEEVETNNRPSQTQKPKSKKTKKGDWELEEVGGG